MATGKAAGARDRHIALPTKESRAIPGGFDIIADTALHTGDWYGVLPLEALAFTSMKDGNGDTITSVAKFDNLPVGITQPIPFTEVQLTSGSFAAFKS